MSPWRRSYYYRKKAKWEKEVNYCETTVKTDPLYQKGRRFLDLMDMTIMDFFIGNEDRHHYQVFK